jgi:DNA-binding PadR family transcriptional regulator
MSAPEVPSVMRRKTADDFRELAGTGWAVLGLLSFGEELSGYDLKKWADNSLRFFYWSPAISQIYGELKRLEGLGYVTAREVPQDDLRNKRLYRITPEGEEALRRWVQHSPVDPPMLKHGVVLRVWLGHLAEPSDLRAVVEQHRDFAGGMIDDLSAARRGAEATPARQYSAAVIRWGQRYYEAERELADKMLAELDELAGRA